MKTRKTPGTKIVQSCVLGHGKAVGMATEDRFRPLTLEGLHGLDGLHL